MYCKNCGKQITEDSNFCEFCGTKVDRKKEEVDISKYLYKEQSLDYIMGMKKPIEIVDANIKSRKEIIDDILYSEQPLNYIMANYENIEIDNGYDIEEIIFEERQEVEEVKEKTIDEILYTYQPLEFVVSSSNTKIEIESIKGNTLDISEVPAEVMKEEVSSSKLEETINIAIDEISEGVKKNRIEDIIDRIEEKSLAKSNTSEIAVEDEDITEAIEAEAVARKNKVVPKSVINKDVNISDLAPSDFDDLMPKKHHTLLIVLIVLALIIGVGIFIYFDLNKDKKEEVIDYNSIIREYGTKANEAASEYLSDHDDLESFKDIESLIKYDKHKVSCKETFVNIDGTIYLNKCTVDGVEVDASFGKKKDINSKDDDLACKINHNSDTNKLEFYVNGEILSVYECTHDKCGLYETENFKYNSCMDKIAVIEDGNDKILYNYQAGQEAANKFSEIAAVVSENKYKGFIYRDSTTNLYGYMSIRGVDKLKAEYTFLALNSDDILYSRGINYSEDKIRACMNKKCGVLKLSDASKIIDFKYDDIYLGYKDNYVAKLDNNYYLIDSTGKKIIQNGYDMIFAFANVLVIHKNDKLSIVDYDGNKIINDELDTYVDYKIEPNSNGVFGYNAYNVDNNIVITIDKNSQSGYITYKYVYNMDSKKLTKEE